MAGLAIKAKLRWNDGSEQTGQAGDFESLADAWLMVRTQVKAAMAATNVGAGSHCSIPPINLEQRMVLMDRIIVC